MDFNKQYDNYVNILLKEHKEVFAKQNVEELCQFVTAIKNAERVFLIGAGREGIATRGFAMRIMHLGKKAYWIWDDTTPAMRAKDLLIAVNGSGKIGHINYLIEQARRSGADISVVTGAPLEQIPQMAKYQLFVPACVYKGTDQRVVGSVQPMGNLFEQHLFLLFDIVSMLLREEMECTFEEMESKHRNIE